MDRNPSIETGTTPRMGHLWNEPADELARYVATAEGGPA